MPISLQSLWTVHHHCRPIKHQWIKGHQDSTMAYSTLPLAICQQTTSQHTHGEVKPSVNTDHHPTEHVSMSINGHRVTSQYNSFLCYHLRSMLLTGVERNKDWTDGTWDSINFTAFGPRRCLSPHIQIRHMKFIYDQQPLGLQR